MRACASDVTLRSLFECDENYSKLCETGYAKASIQLTMNDRDDIANTLVDYHCSLKVKASMDQFIDGLTSVGLGKFLQICPELLKPLFVYSERALTPGKDWSYT